MNFKMRKESVEAIDNVDKSVENKVEINMTKLMEMLGSLADVNEVRNDIEYNEIVLYHIGELKLVELTLTELAIYLNGEGVGLVDINNSDSIFGVVIKDNESLDKIREYLTSRA